MEVQRFFQSLKDESNIQHKATQKQWKQKNKDKAMPKVNGVMHTSEQVLKMLGWENVDRVRDMYLMVRDMYLD